MAEDANPEAPRHVETLLTTGGVVVSLLLAEPIIFLSGFSRGEQSEQPPALLRGSLVVRMIKPTKIKAISLAFRGISRTEWPEGIPPEKSETYESKEVFSHEWKFFNAGIPGAEATSGAHSMQTLEEPSAVAGNTLSSVKSPLAMSFGGNGGNDHGDSTLLRPRASTLESSVKGVLNNLRSDSPNRIRPKLSTATNGSSNLDANSREWKGYRTFQPAEYVYNFELLLPQRLPETVKCNFGSVRWLFDLHVDRPGTFKTNWISQHEITLLRSLGVSNLEISEPIVINRNWEDLLHYEIIIAGKAFPIGGTIPIAFSLVPFAKVRCHRIRLYITEHTEYYCKDRRVHRVEPSHKFLLLEEVSGQGIKGSLLRSQNDIATLTEMEFDVKVPRSFPNRHGHLRPNANTEHIKVHHWIKVVMRLSRANPMNPNGKMKCYELSIDSPITLVDSRTVTANQLPAYQRMPERVDEASEMSIRPYQEFVQDASFVDRPIHFVRQPSVAPPPFDADSRPPELLPPGYDALEVSPADYRRRFDQWIQHEHRKLPPESIPSGMGPFRGGPESEQAPSPRNSGFVDPGSGITGTGIGGTGFTGYSHADIYRPGASSMASGWNPAGPIRPTAGLGGPTVTSDPLPPRISSESDDRVLSDQTSSGQSSLEGRMSTDQTSPDNGSPAMDGRPHFSEIIWRDEGEEVDEGSSSSSSSSRGRAAQRDSEARSRTPSPSTRGPLDNPVAAEAPPGASSAAVSAAALAESENSARMAASRGQSLYNAPAPSGKAAGPPLVTPALTGYAGAGGSSDSPLSPRNRHVSSAGSLRAGAVSPAPGAFGVSLGGPLSGPHAARLRQYQQTSPQGMSPTPQAGPSSSPSLAGSRTNSFQGRSPSMSAVAAGLTPNRGPRTSADAWWDRRDSAGSASGRYLRQSSVVSVDLAEQGGEPISRRPSHISEISEAPEWYPLSRTASTASLPISINEYRGRSPLLGDMDSVNDIAALGLDDDYDFEDDLDSIHSACYNILSS